MEQWSEVLTIISQNIGKPSFETWLKNTTAEINDEVVTVQAQNEFQADWLRERYQNLIAEAVKEVTGKELKITFSNTDETNVKQQPQTKISSNSSYDELREQLLAQQEKINKLEEKIASQKEESLKFVYHNDTDRKVIIHPATESHGTKCDMAPIKPQELRVFYLPEGTYPWVKMWDHGEKGGLVILVSPLKDSLT